MCQATILHTKNCYTNILLCSICPKLRSKPHRYTRQIIPWECHFNVTICHYICWHIYITLMALMWHRYKMTPRSFKGHFKVKVNKLILLGWLPRFSFVTNLGKIIVNFFKILFKSKGFLPLKTMFRYEILKYSNHFKCFGLNKWFWRRCIGIKRCLFSKT